MQQPKYAMDNSPDDRSLLEQPRMSLLNEKHWHYIQRRYYISPRELEVARLVCYGFNNDEIARDLKIKHGTVKTHIRNIYRRIRVKNKIGLLLKFLQDVTEFSSESGTAPPAIRVSEIPKKDKKKSHNPLDIPRKG